MSHSAEKDAGSEGFSERFANDEPLPCGRCWRKGFFHWPLLADHKPTPVPPSVTPPGGSDV